MDNNSTSNNMGSIPSFFNEPPLPLVNWSTMVAKLDGYGVTTLKPISANLRLTDGRSTTKDLPGQLNTTQGVILIVVLGGWALAGLLILLNYVCSRHWLRWRLGRRFNPDDMEETCCNKVFNLIEKWKMLYYRPLKKQLYNQRSASGRRGDTGHYRRRRRGPRFHGSEFGSSANLIRSQNSSLYSSSASVSVVGDERQPVLLTVTSPNTSGCSSTTSNSLATTSPQPRNNAASRRQLSTSENSLTSQTTLPLPIIAEEQEVHL